MFSGIVEAIGIVRAIETVAAGRRLWIQAPFVEALSLGNSVAHDGACLSVIAIKHRFYCVEAVQETLNRTTLGDLDLGDSLNLERALPVSARLEGHLVQGHVDTVLEVLDVTKVGGESFYFSFSLPEQWAPYVVEKGSIAINGVSLTVAGVEKGAFRVAIIPWTYQHTTFSQLKRGSKVNVEFDIIAKYLWHWTQAYGVQLSKGASHLSK
ncbi:MAG: riboflavin synthase [Bacteroidia bacterium]|nr:riboflavin synthase [Bacteroidia bacterium]MCX7651366.1 riboflavin synthase [Bacteroidia bacterium]MDW8416734.1 riboflavin synthase [Bacteroidia bacterium]